MTPFLACDTEDDSKGNPFLINFFDGESHSTFSREVLTKKGSTKRQSVKALRKKSIEHLLKIPDQNAIIWCVNLQYDLINLFADHFELLEISYVGSRVISARIAGSNIRFFDTLNHWKISVEKMGERIGLKKLDPNGNFNNVEYCQRDTEITWRFVKKMQDAYEQIGCKLKSTIGSTSLQFFEREFYKHEPKRLFTRPQLEFLRGGYYGGRTEVFHTEPVTGKIFYFDFNSLYPSVMRDKFPVLREMGHKFTKDPDFEKFEGMVEVTIKAPNNILPYLPYRDEKGRLIFPLGTFRGRYTYFEIREALNLGYEIKKIHKALEFHAGNFYPFREFVEFMYKKRLEAQAQKDELMSDAYKLLPNNLYGKYGQGDEFEKLVPHYGEIKPGDLILGPLVLRKSKQGFPVHTNFIWPAYTTAYGRHKLYYAMSKSQKKGALLLYCDTDSLIFENQSPIFKDSKDLGELKLEKPKDSKYPFFGYAHFKLPKLYNLATVEDLELKKKGTFKAKGVPRQKAEEFFLTGKATYKKPNKLRETLRRNLSPNRRIKLIPNFWEDIEKQSRKKYDKRVVLSDGRTRPIEI